MNSAQVADFCLRYLEATGCRILEKSPAHVKVKLSPEADRDLTGRPYYWNFVERTGAEPETMSFLFIFDPERYAAMRQAAEGGQGSQSGEAAKPDTILGRYLGVAPLVPQPGRTLEETLAFGSGRLDKMIAAAREKGGYLQLFEQPPPMPRGGAASLSYTTWLAVNYKVEFICDMKCEELHSLGISMGTGEIAERFFPRMEGRPLTPQIPPGIALRETISLERAVRELEAHLERKLKERDYRWAEEALQRLEAEIERVDDYYGELLHSADPDERPGIEQQYRHRRDEIEWQYRPRVEVSIVNCGFFHLPADSLRP